MTFMKKMFVHRFTAGVALCVLSVSLAFGNGDETRESPAREIARLKEGNARFVSGARAQRDLKADRAAVVAGQTPYAIVLTCADSRVAPELVFDESLGQLFVVRNAGNVLDSVVLGSIEYAAEHLHAKLLVILGHQSCGAVKATVAGGDLPPNIGSIVHRIAPAVRKVKGAGTQEAAMVDASIAENARMQVEQTGVQSSLLEEMKKKQEFSIVGAVYDLESGAVTFLESQEGGTDHSGE